MIMNRSTSVWVSLSRIRPVSIPPPVVWLGERLAQQQQPQPQQRKPQHRGMASLAHRRFRAGRKKGGGFVGGGIGGGFVGGGVGKVPGPSLEMAKEMPLSPREMDNPTLLALAALENHEARIEILKRNIMGTDGVSYEDACLKFEEIKAFNHENIFWVTIPYKLGVITSLTAALASIPLCFHLPTVHWFNHYFVTSDVPEPADLETWLEVGSWSWNWMEPPLGQISFFLLCLQFSRAQLDNLGVKPWTSHMRHRRAARLVRAYPQYDPEILADFSYSAGFT